MKIRRARLTFWILSFLIAIAIPARSTVLYVDASASNPSPPYSDWSTAAQAIQDAVDVANPGDQILVTNGVYQTGGKVWIIGSLLSRVLVDKPVNIQSVNGPAVTVIQGNQIAGTTNGDGAIRCVFLTNGASLAGFTLNNGATRAAGSTTTADQEGGGIYCLSPSAVISNCVIAGNSAWLSGGGARRGSLYNCILSGNSATNGAGADSAYLKNCTITGNSALKFGGGSYSSTNVNCTLANNSAVVAGGGAYSGNLTNCILSANMAGSGGGANLAALQNCILTNNSAVTNGGGTYGGSLISCALSQNSAAFGGGAYAGAVTNCTLTENTAAAYGGGIYSSTNYNCIIYYNTAPLNANYDFGRFNYCCTTPLPAAGTGNITSEPQFASAFRLTLGSPCRSAGSPAFLNGTDIDGESWASPPSIGCDEFYSSTATGSLSVGIQAAFTNVVAGAPLSFTANITGLTASNLWSFGDSTVVANQISPSHSWSAAGDYPVVLTAYNNTFPGGISSTVTVHVVTQQIYYVSSASTSPIAPYTSWSTAARNIQDALNAATVSGAEILVTNGVYNGGGQVVYGSISNRVAVTGPMTLKSVNGPAVTSIVGHQVPGSTNGTGAVRCVYLANGATLAGFTLTNGATTASGDGNLEQSGGAVWSAVSAGIISNCVLAGNSAYANGGGGFSGTLAACTVINNHATQAGGGCYAGVLTNSTLSINTASSGGGACNCTLDNCALTGNSSLGVSAFPNGGGGANNCILYGCTLTGNSAMSGGGGAILSSLNNCQFTNNVAINRFGGGGEEACNMTNCVLFGNSATNGGGAYDSVSDLPCVLQNCLFVSNSASYGGGAEGVITLNNCTLIGNSATVQGGGADYNYCTLNDCVLTGNWAPTGGGASGCNLNRCQLSGNSANLGGGGSSCNAASCAFWSNYATNSGGGTYSGWLYNCTLVHNVAGVAGGGDSGSSVVDNSILYFNEAPIGTNFYNSTLNYCCATPAPANGIGNISNDPLFVNVAADFHLQAQSPCINSGLNAYCSITSDLDGNPRIKGGTVDMGAYEFQSPASMISYAWLDQYGLPTDGSADFVDSDGDGMNNWQEWRAGTDPMNSSSVLKLLPPASNVGSNGLVVSWQSVSNVTYFVQRGTNLALSPSFSSIQSNLIGQAAVTSYTDNTATNVGPYFYRVGVQ
jgi:hypothetical protein